MEKQKRSKSSKIISYIWDIVFALIVIPIVGISIMLIAKSLMEPDKIPDIFGYKPFIIIDGKMDEQLNYGDLVITKEVDAKTLNKGDIIAFRNNENYITLHQIKEITQKNDKRIFEMRVSEDEVNTTKYANEEKIEGKLVKIIPHVGEILFFIQDIRGLGIIVLIILVIGGIAYYIARKLDKKDEQIEEKIKEGTNKI